MRMNGREIKNRYLDKEQEIIQIGGQKEGTNVTGERVASKSVGSFDSDSKLLGV